MEMFFYNLCNFRPFSPEVYAVTYGKYKSFDVDPFEVDRNISKIAMHPGFSPTTLLNDIILLKVYNFHGNKTDCDFNALSCLQVDKPIRFTRRRQPICQLPQDFPTDATFGDTFAGKKSCTTLGWGATGRKEIYFLMFFPIYVYIPILYKS